MGALFASGVFRHSSRPPSPAPPRRPGWKPPRAFTLLLTVGGVLLAIIAGGTAFVWVGRKLYGLILAGLYSIGMFKPDMLNGHDYSDATFVAFILTGLSLVATIITVFTAFAVGDDK